MRLHMLFKTRGVDKSRIANSTGMWIYACVGVNVITQCSVTPELFLAKLADKTLTAVSVHVAF